MSQNRWCLAGLLQRLVRRSLRSPAAPGVEPGASLSLGGKDVAHQAPIGGDRDPELLRVDHFRPGNHRQAYVPARLVRPLHARQEPLKCVGRGKPGQRRRIDQEVPGLIPAGGRDGGADQGYRFVERDGANRPIESAPPPQNEAVEFVQTSPPAAEPVSILTSLLLIRKIPAARGLSFLSTGCQSIFVSPSFQYTWSVFFQYTCNGTSPPAQFN